MYRNDNYDTYDYYDTYDNYDDYDNYDYDNHVIFIDYFAIL